MNNCGLNEKEWQEIRSYLADNPRIDRAILYGSRAKGCHKPFSDVDLTLEGKDLTRRDLLDLAAQLDDSLLPYTFDLSVFGQLKNEQLRDHIHRCGIVVYEK